MFPPVVHWFSFCFPNTHARPPLLLPPPLRLLYHSSIQNLARTLAYNRRCLALLPLDRGAAAELADSCESLSAALQCVLSL